MCSMDVRFVAPAVPNISLAISLEESVGNIEKGLQCRESLEALSRVVSWPQRNYPFGKGAVKETQAVDMVDRHQASPVIYPSAMPMLLATSGVPRATPLMSQELSRRVSGYDPCPGLPLRAPRHGIYPDLLCFLLKPALSSARIRDFLSSQSLVCLRQLTLVFITNSLAYFFSFCPTWA